MTSPRQHKWKPISSPKALTVNWSISEADYAKLSAGFDAKDMDDRWDVQMGGDTLHFYRSWSGFEVYNFTPTKRGGRYIVESFNVERDSSRYGNVDDGLDVEWLTQILENICGVTV